MKLFSTSIKAMVVVATMAHQGFAFAGTPDDNDPYKPPEYGPTTIVFTACTAGSHEATVQIKISNFSPYDMTLPANKCVDANNQEQSADSPDCTCEYGEKITDAKGKTTCPFYKWATKEENAAVAQKYMKENLSKQIAKDRDEAAAASGYLSELVQRGDVISGTLEDGRTGDWPVSVSLKTMLQTKMELMASGKYSSLSINLLPENSFVTVNPEAECAL